jgi:protein-tyrosine phosphatase
MMGTTTTPHNFGPASNDETIVYGASRPEPGSIQDWIHFMQTQGIRRVCCLLSQAQLKVYTTDLLTAYRAAFGAGQVCAAPIEDFHLATLDLLQETILPFLVESARLEQQVVVHCYSGKGRTGHVLAAWLEYGRRLGIDQALRAVQAVPGVERKPLEAVGVTTTRAEFYQRFQAIAQLASPFA